MKILNLSFKNLNALKGDWHIDFTDPAFDEGIFAIVGKTGAGKTTILDAICLAIYGQTPRLSTISPSQNDLMSVDTGECMAQVVLMVRDEMYRFRWEQVRAGKKANGKLQAIKRQISRLSHPYDDNGEILQTKYCDKLVVELLGMKFGQFTRSVMLAQGDFSAFLKANADEKSAILEQITGTDIYSKISLHTHLIHKNKKAQLDTLKDKLSELSTLSNDELDTLNAQLLAQNHTLSTQKAQMVKLDEALLVCQDKQRIGDEIAEFMKHAPCTFEPPTHPHPPISTKEQLVILRQLQQLTSNINTAQHTHQQSIKTHDELSQKITDIDHSIATTQHQIQHHLDTLRQTTLPDLTNAELFLDNLSTLTIYKETLTQLHEIISKQHEQLNDEQHALNQQIANHQAHQTTLNEVNAQQTTLIQAIIDHFGLSEARPPSSLINDIEQALAFAHQQTQHRTKQHDCQARLNTLNEQIHHKTLSDNEHSQAINIVQQHITQSEQRIALLEQNLALSYELSALKKHAQTLSEGTPCPLCGSTIHPNKHDHTNNTPSPIEHELADAKATLVKYQHTLKQHEIGQSTVRSELYYLCQEQLTLTQTLNTLDDEMTALNSRLGSLSLHHVEAVGKTQHLVDYQNYLNNQTSHYGTFKTQFKDLEYQETQHQHKLHTLLSEGLASSHVHLNHHHQLINLIRQFLHKQSDTHQLIHQTVITDIIKHGITLHDTADNVVMCETFYEPFLAHATKYLNELTQLINALNNIKHQLNQHKHTQENLTALNTQLAHHHAQKHTLNNELANLAKEQQNNANTLTTLMQHQQAQVNTLLSSWVDTTITPPTSLMEVLTTKTTLLHHQLDDLNIQKQTLQSTMDTLLQDIGKNQQRLADNQNIKQAQSTLRTQIQSLENEFAIWDKLNTLIGSHDGKKYRTFAQGLTLDLLLYYANQALATMNERYVLCTDDGNTKTALDIHVIDTAQGGEMRSTKNLSGGESFIISLALAIGLSSMNSDTVSIDSLFLDEGFGTLDEETLDIALATLSTLHTSGKMIGIISHVVALKEQIHTQILVKKGLHGKSTLSGAGVRQLCHDGSNPQNF